MINFDAFADAYYAPPTVELGFLVNLKVLRGVLKSLSVSGRRWWIASDPADAVSRGDLTIGHGDENCVDRLNTLSFRVPVMNRDAPWGGTDHILLLIDDSSIVLEQAGFYVEDGVVEKDELEDLRSFFGPLKSALIRAAQS